MKDYLFTSESVCSGHPDKICDQVSDAILDAVLKSDPNGRVAVETIAANDHIILAGEVSSKYKIPFEEIARCTIKKLGYTDPHMGFSYNSPLDNYIHTQSSEIAKGVKKKGAGDQGMMFGYACRDTESYMPLPITIAHMLTKSLDTARESKTLPYLRPDGKSQVTIKYKNGVPTQVTSVVIAVPHNEEISLEQVKDDIYKYVVSKILDSYGFTLPISKFVINGTGIWHRGGPASDAGLTGRKIVVDTYGGYARVGGGAFSGKDPSKVDRSGAYAARYIAKNIVAHGLAQKAEVSLAYFIGAKKPLMQEIETFGTETKEKRIIESFVEKLLDTSVEGIVDGLNLKRPIYLPTAAYGHFGRSEFPWEKIT